MDRSSLRVASVLAGIVSGVLLVPRVADACSCIGGVTILVPAEDEPHPASAGLLLDAWCFSGTFDSLSAVVDDVPVALTIDDLGGDAAHVAMLDPPPRPGQTVVVSRCGDPEGYEACGPDVAVEQVLQYTAGPIDDVAPPGGGEVRLQHEIGEFEVGCLRLAALRYTVSLTGLDQADEPDVVYTIELRNSDGEVVGTRVFDADEPTPSLDVFFELTSVPDDVAEHCVSVTGRDLSGNSTLVAELCGSESLDPDEDTGTDAGDDTGDIPPTEDGDDDSSNPPADDTNGDDASPDGTSTDDPDADGELGDRGCSCRATTPAPASAWLVLLAVATLRRRSSANAPSAKRRRD